MIGQMLKHLTFNKKRCFEPGDIQNLKSTRNYAINYGTLEINQSNFSDFSSSNNRLALSLQPTV